MKTRILKTEYNNGQIEYTCQHNPVSEQRNMYIFLLCTVIFTVPALLDIVFGKWICLKNTDVIPSKDRDKTSPKTAEFNSLTEAEAFILLYLEQVETNRVTKAGLKVKKTTKIKYP